MWEAAVNAAGGVAIRDINGTTYRYDVQLTILDDNSTAQSHDDAVDALLTTYNVHFVLGASPVFANTETVKVQNAGRLNFHCCAATASVYSRDQKNVFGKLGGERTSLRAVRERVCSQERSNM